MKTLDWSKRENTLDEFIINEKDYDRCDFQKTDRWLDAGANIGAFAVKYANKVNSIYSFEPEEENCKLLIENCKKNNATNVYIHQQALVGNDDQTRSFYVNTKKNKGVHGFLAKRGRQEVIVECININDIIKMYGINKAKIDIEGSEYELMQVIDLEPLKEIIMEYHFLALKDKDKKKYFEIIHKLQHAGFNVQYKEDPKKAWTTIIYAVK